MTAPTLPAMTPDQIEILRKHAREHGSWVRPEDEFQWFVDQLVAARDAQWAARLDAAVRDEREACAKVCDQYAQIWCHQSATLRDAIRARTKA